MEARLNDLEIAKEIQVNRLSVREALFRLIETGTIEKTKNSIREHRLILEALKSRDEELSVERLVAHLSLHKQLSKNGFPSFKPNTQPA